MTRRTPPASRAPATDSPRTARGYRVRDFCAREGISRATCWRWVSKGLIRTSRVGPAIGVRVAYADDGDIEG